MKVFVIHYKKMIKRKENILRQFKKFGITDYEFIDIDRSEVFSHDLSKINTSINPAWIAVFLSHSYAYKQIANLYDEALILEDDAIMSDDFIEKFTLYRKELDPSFDMLFIGSGCNLHIDNDKIIDGKHIYRKYNDEINCYGGQGATRCVDSYLVSKNCAEKLCNYIDNIDSSSLVNSETDLWLNKVGKELDLVVYWAEPTICSQGSQIDPNDGRCY